MASTGSDVPAAADNHPAQHSSTHDTAHDTSTSQKPSTPHEHPPFNFQPVELDDLMSTSNTVHTTTTPRDEATNVTIRQELNINSNPDISSTPSQPTQPQTPSPPITNPQTPPTSAVPIPPQSTQPQDSSIHRTETAPAIGAASDHPHADMEPEDMTSTMLLLTLLLNTGGRHAFKLDDKYLKKRNVTVEDNNPINLSVYTLKELIWRDWRSDWDPRPASPTSIRLIYFGKLLEDKSHLQESKFENGDKQHVIHMTVKPQEVVDDEDARIAKGAGRSGEDGERSHGCRCVIL